MQKKGDKYLLRRAGESSEKRRVLKTELTKAARGLHAGEQGATVIYNQKYVFGLHPHFWHRVLKTLVIS